MTGIRSESGLSAEASPTNQRITPRETQILVLLALGHSAREISARLTLSVHTVRKHIKNIYQKVAARNRIEAIIKTKWLTASLLSANTNC